MGEKVEVLIDPKKMNQQATIYTIAIGLISIALYYSIWGFTWNLSVTAFLKFYVFGFIGILIHELIHAIGFIVIGKVKLSDIKFGFILKNMTPYAHCKIPLSMRAYKISILLPVLITGFLPLSIGLATNNLLTVVVSAFLIAGGIGDWIIYRKLRPFSKHAVVSDHPTEIGCIVEIKSMDVFLTK